MFKSEDAVVVNAWRSAAASGLNLIHIYAKGTGISRMLREMFDNKELGPANITIIDYRNMYGTRLTPADNGSTILTHTRKKHVREGILVLVEPRFLDIHEMAEVIARHEGPVLFASTENLPYLTSVIARKPTVFITDHLPIPLTESTIPVIGETEYNSTYKGPNLPKSQRLIVSKDSALEKFLLRAHRDSLYAKPRIRSQYLIHLFTRLAHQHYVTEVAICNQTLLSSPKIINSIAHALTTEFSPTPIIAARESEVADMLAVEAWRELAENFTQSLHSYVTEI